MLTNVRRTKRKQSGNFNKEMENIRKYKIKITDGRIQ